jgi:hypothetical protein
MLYQGILYILRPYLETDNIMIVNTGSRVRIPVVLPPLECGTIVEGMVTQRLDLNHTYIVHN